MMEGIYFHWFSWIFCVIVLFFMPKSKYRTYLIYWIFISIMLANLYITIGTYTISLSFIVIFFGAFLSFSVLKGTFYHIIASFIIMIGYAGILLLEKNAPIWIFGPRYLVISVLSVLLIIVLSNDFYPRVMTALVGLCSGEALYSLIIINYHLPKTLGELAFMDSMLITIFLLLLVSQYQKIKQRFKIFIKNHS